MSSETVTAQCLVSSEPEARRLLALVPAVPGLDLARLELGQLDLGGPAGCAVLDWARWGLMALTGPASGPPSAPVAPVAARVRGLLAALEAVTGSSGVPVRLDPARVLAGRSALNGWSRAGAASANGSCRLLPAQDGWLAVSLSRPDDVDSVPAVLGRQFEGSPWPALGQAAREQPAARLAAAAQALGIPAAVLGSEAALAPLRITDRGLPAARRRGDGVRDTVLDLSAMWAGPLCAHILGRSGARVIKVEDVNRPDGARSGPAAFYDELHSGHESVRLDFSTAAGRRELADLADQAQVVLESSRPRALRGLGLVAEDWLAHRPGRSWISITGYGRDDPAQRVAFGDDAAVAGGLVAPGPDGTAGPFFCGDAIADPLTGLYAGLAACASRAAGGGHLVDVRMAGVSADLARPAEQAENAHPVTVVDGDWVVRHGDRTARIGPR